MPCRCYVVPPHLLRGIAESSHNPDHVRKAAHASLAAHERVLGARKDRFTALTTPRGYQGIKPVHRQPQHIIPEHLLRYVAESENVDDITRARAKRDLDHLQTVLAGVKAMQEGGTSDQHTLNAAAEEANRNSPKTKPYRAVYDAKHSANQGQLPGKLVRAEGEKKVKDKAVNDAYNNVGIVLQFYKEHFNWNSIDNKNMDVISTVHFGKAYENAFWDPEQMQMVFGDGDEFLGNFTGTIDVIGHELTHAVTEHTSPLDYEGQPGALNEHVSDVFGIMIKQQVQNEKSAVADWLIGEDCIEPGVKGTALRSMKAPGTAYNDPRFGKDPQVANMKDFKTTYDDNGGVHIYSGIPNKAFYNAAVAFGGYSWEKAGKVWWQTIKSGRVPAKSTFEQFANVTVDTARGLFGDDGANKVTKAWSDVGVLGGGGQSPRAPDGGCTVL